MNADIQVLREMGTNARDIRKKRVLILGTGMFAITLANEIMARPQCGLTVIGLVSEQEKNNAISLKIPILGEISRLAQIILEQKPDRIMVTVSDQLLSRYCHALVEEKFFRRIQIDDGEDFYEKLTGKLAIDTLSQNALMLSKDFQLPARSQMLSRLFSFIFALIALVLTAPIMVLIALLIKIDSGGPILFVQSRVGLGNKTFDLYKFRTMHPSTLKTSEWACDNDERITRIGRFLRRFRLDELPQLINVLRNEMNIVGPRPHPSSNYELYALVSRNTHENGNQIPYYYLRSLVRPGITGWAQVKYRYANNLSEEIEKLRFDLYYIKHYSLWLDAKILLATVKVVLMGHKPKS